MSDDHDLARPEPSGRDRQAELAGVKGHGEIGPNRRARRLAGGRVDSRGKIDGDDRGGGGVDPLDQRGGLRARLAAEPRAEERIDDHVGLLDGRGLDGVATRLPEDARRDPPVAAVRARSADDGEPAGVGKRVERLARDRGSGALHQLCRRLREAGIALLGSAHLRRRVERLEHAA